MTMPKFEPVAFLFQHEDTGLTSAVDVQQVEWGFEKNNPRHINCGPLYTAEQLAAALVACKLKDEALQNCEGMLDELRDYPITHDAIIEALAIQPDDSALKDEWRFK